MQYITVKYAKTDGTWGDKTYQYEVDLPQTIKVGDVPVTNKYSRDQKVLVVNTQPNQKKPAPKLTVALGGETEKERLQEKFLSLMEEAEAVHAQIVRLELREEVQKVHRELIRDKISPDLLRAAETWGITLEDVL